VLLSERHFAELNHLDALEHMNNSNRPKIPEILEVHEQEASKNTTEFTGVVMKL